MKMQHNSTLKIAPPAIYSIRDMARIYNVSLRTLRFYEERELLKPQRVGQERYYSDRDRNRLEFVLKGKRLGFTLAEIWKLSNPRMRHAANPDWSSLLGAFSESEILSQLNRLKCQRRSINEMIEELRSLYGQLDRTEREEAQRG